MTDSRETGLEIEDTPSVGDGVREIVIPDQATSPQGAISVGNINDVFIQRRIARNMLEDQLMAEGHEYLDPKEIDGAILPRINRKKPWRDVITTDPSRNELLTEKGREALANRYLSKNEGDEDFQDIFARVAWAGADDEAHARRLYDYISKHWFMPATPVLSNLGTNRGLPISCFLQDVDDSMASIIAAWSELAWMSAKGGGVGTFWGRVRPVSEPVSDVGKTSGIIPFIGVQDKITLGVSQGGVRRGSSAVYLPVSHPEIAEFLSVRDPSGDINRKALNLHNAVLIDDAFMEAVRKGTTYDLISPKTKKKAGEVDARELFGKIIETRVKTGEPYIIFIDTVNRAMPEHHRKLGLKVSMSNLCSEITLPTGKDHKNRHRSAVCCLSSLNLIYWSEYEDNDQFFEDVYRFLDNVLQEFILRAPEELQRAIYSAHRERSVGLGVMGFHSLLQKKGIPWETAIAKSINKRIFRKIRAQADRCSRVLAEKKGACPDAAECNVMERFSYKLAIAPTASISVIAGGASAGIEPIPANIVSHKTLDGDHPAWNPDLLRVLAETGLDTPEIRSSIIQNAGSVQHLEMLDQSVRDVFKTAFEIDPRWIIELMGDRAEYIDQAASNNLFIPPDANKLDLLYIHLLAHEKGVKSLYYCRSKSIQQAGNLFVDGTGDVSADNTLVPARITTEVDYEEECLACQ